MAEREKKGTWLPLISLKFHKNFKADFEKI